MSGAFEQSKVFRNNFVAGRPARVASSGQPATYRAASADVVAFEQSMTSSTQLIARVVAAGHLTSTAVPLFWSADNDEGLHLVRYRRF